MNRKVILTILAVLLLASIAVAPASAQSGDFEVVRQAAEAYLSSGKAPTISADDLFANLNDGDTSNDPFIVSVRSAEHYALGHIPGAINIPYKTIAKTENLAQLPKDRQIVVYCYTGHTGQIATTVLNLLDYNAINLKFGIMGWTRDDAVLAQKRFGPDTDQRDYPVQTEPNVPTETYALPALTTGGANDFEIVRLAADNWLNNPATPPIVSAESVFTNLNDGDDSNNPVIVSVRAADHYALGHIAGAINIPWKSIASVENLAKLPADRVIATYCYTGHTGMVAATILGMLGYQAGNIKYGMMGWTKDDAVLAQKRFDPNTQPDYRLETGAPVAAAAPATVPTTGGPLAFSVLLSSLGLIAAGLALRKRAAALSTRSDACLITRAAHLSSLAGVQYAIVCSPRSQDAVFFTLSPCHPVTLSRVFMEEQKNANRNSQSIQGSARVRDATADRRGLGGLCKAGASSDPSRRGCH